LSLVLLDDPEPDWKGHGDGKTVYTVVPTTRVSVVTCDPWDAESVAVRVLRMVEVLTDGTLLLAWEKAGSTVVPTGTVSVVT
jgi:hypothetical protein